VAGAGAVDAAASVVVVVQGAVELRRLLKSRFLGEARRACSVRRG
jgi:hypothetical protein